MKMMCYLVLIIGFIIFYQQNPVYAIIVMAVIIGGYLMIKSKRSQSAGRGLFGFMKGNQQQGTGNFDDLITLMMIQQLLSNNSNHGDKKLNDSHEEGVEKIKQEILDLFDE
jgi:hypothetical protein